MEWALAFIGVVVFLVMVIRANWNDRLREANDELQDYYDSLSENNDIDSKLDDERVQHVQDKFND